MGQTDLDCVCDCGSYIVDCISHHCCHLHLWVLCGQKEKKGETENSRTSERAARMGVCMQYESIQVVGVMAHYHLYTKCG